jgi:L-seryl-tRNA(Ser) seleniumtransferase
MTLAALEATLRLYQQPELLAEHLPTLRLLTKPQQHIQAASERLLIPLTPHFSGRFILRSEACWSQIGSGSLPIDRLPSYALTFAPVDGRGASLEHLAQQWRQLAQPIIGRINDGKLWLDLRCLEQESALIEALTQ